MEYENLSIRKKELFDRIFTVDITCTEPVKWYTKDAATGAIKSFGLDSQYLANLVDGGCVIKHSEKISDENLKLLNADSGTLYVFELGDVDEITDVPNEIAEYFDFSLDSNIELLVLELRWDLKN